MQLTRRRLVATMTGAALAAGVAGAAVAKDMPYNLKPGKPYAGTQINILSVVTPQFDGLMLRDKEFTDLTGIKTKWTFIPFTALQEKVSAVGVAADGSFDVVNYLDSWGPPNSHWLVPLNDKLARDGISMDRYPAAFAKSASFQGKVLGFPLRAHAMLMFYRKDIFDKLGLAAPKSWGDVIAASKKIRASGEKIEPLALYYHNDGNRQNLFIWLNYLWSAGADVFDKQFKPTWATDAGLKATEDYIALHTSVKATNPASLSFVEQDARQSFMQGKSAMIPVWWWAYSSMINPKSSVLKPGQVAFTGLPTYQGRSVTYAISMPFSISKHSKNQEASWEFLKWLSNPKMDKANATERKVAGKTIINNVVTHKVNLQDPEVNAANANIQMAAWGSLKNSDIMPQIPEWTEVGDILSAAIAKAAAGGDVRKLMTDAAARTEKILKRAGYYK